MMERPVLQVDEAPAFTGSQLFVIDVLDRPIVPAVVGSLAGYQYRLPALQRLEPVCCIRTFDDTSYSAELDNQGLFPAPKPSQLKAWLLTLRDPTGADLMRQCPLLDFLFNNRTRPRYFAGLIIDPLQSHLECTVDNQLTAPVLMFDYCR